MQSFIQEKEESFLVNESNKIQYIFNLNDVNEIINALGTSFSREIQNGIDCDLLEEIISCLRHILCLVVKDLNQNLIKYCQEYANDSSNAAYILTDIEWIFETIFIMNRFAPFKACSSLNILFALSLDKLTSTRNH